MPSRCRGYFFRAVSKRQDRDLASMSRMNRFQVYTQSMLYSALSL